MDGLLGIGKWMLVELTGSRGIHINRLKKGWIKKRLQRKQRSEFLCAFAASATERSGREMIFNVLAWAVKPVRE
jgi:hypothetical protein